LGGSTITSAPTPRWRSFESLSIPIINPTISRIRVTSTATAVMLIREHMGRCSKLESTSLFIGYPKRPIILAPS
jgi:hypothetical protein